MSVRTQGILAVALGVLLLLLSLGADVLGVGLDPRFGWKQITGALVGGALAGFGIFRLRSH